jgi:hypothetical protein
MLSAILGECDVRLAYPPSLRADQPMPATLSHFGLRFSIR